MDFFIGNGLLGFFLIKKVMDLFFGVIGGVLDNVLVVGNNDCNNDENMECRLFELNVERRFN